jgi:hypothetical protein
LMTSRSAAAMWRCRTWEPWRGLAEAAADEKDEE